MSQQTRSARCVFVGNIPYDATEEQLIEIFQEVGPVVSFRLVFDRDTGKPKGYGFCEYRDAETALSAMRNLNNYDFNGRPLRVDFAETEKAGMQQATGKPAVSTNVPAPNAPSTPDTINNMLEGMSTAQLYEIVSKMKGMIQSNPDQARQILVSNPPLAYALLQAQSILGMINVQTVQKLLTKVQTAPPTTPPMTAQFPTTTAPMPMNVNVPLQPPLQPTIPPSMQPMQPPITIPTQTVPPMQPVPYVTGPGFQPQPAMKATPPFTPQPQMFSQPQPMQQFGPTPMQQQQLVDGLQDHQKALLQQVVSLTPEQIDKLPPEQRQQVQQLRQTLMLTGFRFG